MVRKEVAARRGQGTMYATLLLNFPEIIEIIDENAKAALVAAARKELAYLKKFGRPLLPFQWAYGYKEQSPSSYYYFPSKCLQSIRTRMASLADRSQAKRDYKKSKPDRHNTK